jgi:hypothetical protein
MCVRLTPGGTLAENYGELVKHIPAAVEEMHRAGKSLTLLVYFSRGVDTPDSEWRAQIAKMSSPEWFNPMVAIVSPNLFWRSVVGAMSVIRRPRFEEDIFSDAESGLRWLEARRGKLPSLERALRDWGLVGKPR